VHDRTDRCGGRAPQTALGLRAPDQLSS